jgi:class 3 adenylate cyclase
MAGCTACGQENPSGARFCMSCGVGLSPSCAKCGIALPPGGRFCPQCGTSIDLEEPGEVEMIKLVTILFADVVGSTAMAETMHPEDTRARMAEFFQAMSEEIMAEGGTVERLVGDAIMADFGVPVAREDDAIRAVRTALRMITRLDELNRGRDDALHLQIRIGINTGEVSTGGSFGEQLMVMGDAVNVAARLQQAAEPGSVLIGHRTARAVGSQIAVREVEPLTLKGKTDKVSAFLVDGEIDVREEPSPLTEQAPLVGRSEELDTLRVAFEAVAQTKKPRLVTVIGDPGVGKSRLVEEFVARLHDDAIVLRGRGLPYGEGVSLWPLREILRAEANVLGTDSSETAVEKLSGLVRRLSEQLGDPDRTLGALTATLGLEGPTPGFDDLDPREVHRELRSGWRSFLSALASTRPLVVLIDDLHWVDDSTLGILEDLLQNCDAPVFFVASARPELLALRADWIGRQTAHTPMTLEPLNHDEIQELASGLLEKATLPPHAIKRILDNAEGNPFFLEETVSRLIDLDILRREGGRWKVVGDLSGLDVPDNVQALILSRIDLLPAPQKQALQYASVVGRVFWPGALEGLIPTEDLDDALEGLKRRMLVHELLDSSVEKEIELSFRHPLVRDVAYESLPRRKRGEAHASVAAWIETTRATRVTEVAEVIAHHYERAALWIMRDDFRSKARSYYLLAAHNAAARFAISQAEKSGRKAVELSEGDENVRALDALGDIYILTFKSDAAWDSYQAALKFLQGTPRRRSDDIARLAAKAAIVPTRWRGTMQTMPDDEEVVQTIKLGLDHCGSGDTPDRSLLLSSQAYLLAVMREKRAATASDGAGVAGEALDIARRLDDPDLMSAALDAQVVSMMEDGRYGDIAEVDKQRVSLAPRLVDVRERADAYGTAAGDAFSLGDYRRALQLGTECINASEGLDAGSYLHGLVWRVCAGFMLGKWDAALSDQTEIERLQDEEGSTLPGNLAMWAYGVALLCAELRGDEGAVDRYLRLVSDFNRHRSESGRLFHSYLGAPARALAHRGLYEEARSWLRLDPSFYSGSHLEAACDVIAAQGDWNSAPEILQRVDEEIDRGGLIALPHFRERLAGRLAHATNDLRDADEQLAASARGFKSLDVPWEEAWSRLLRARVLRDLGEPQEAVSQASKAHSTFDSLPAPRERESALTILAELGA